MIDRADMRHERANSPACRNGAGGVMRDAAIVIGLVAIVVAIAAHGPSHTFRFAQQWQVGAAIDALESGRWLLPHNQQNELFRKPQLYTWMLALCLKVTGRYGDFVFRIPTVIASVVTALAVYSLGRRWYCRRVGLLAACFWATALHMSKLTYLALTDMLFAMWITLSIVCADRLLFHPAPRKKLPLWAAGLWASIILGAITKGWGVANLPIVAGFVALSAALWPGFKVLRRVRRSKDRFALMVRLVARRLWRAMKSVRFGWGMLAFVAAMAPLWGAMWWVGGGDFGKLLHFEIWQRITGTGPDPPKPGSAPRLTYLLYYQLPASLFAIVSLLLVPLRRWFSRAGPLCLPLCWVSAVFVPYSMAHGFRPDYLLPCYGAVALLAACGVEAVARRGWTDAGALLVLVRRALMCLPVALGAALAIAGGLYLLHGRMPAFVSHVLPMPYHVSPASRVAPALVAVGGLALIAGGIRAMRRRRFRTAVALTISAMLGVMFLDTHFISPHARSGDGEKARAFAGEVARELGDDEYASCLSERFCTEVYLGRFGTMTVKPEYQHDETAGHISTFARARMEAASRALDELDASGVQWLVTTDAGLVFLGAATGDAESGYVFRYRKWGWGGSFSPRPEMLGDVRAVSDPMDERGWGRLYLIRLERPFDVPWPPVEIPLTGGE